MLNPRQNKALKDFNAKMNRALGNLDRAVPEKSRSAAQSQAVRDLKSNLQSAIQVLFNEMGMASDVQFSAETSQEKLHRVTQQKYSSARQR